MPKTRQSGQQASSAQKSGQKMSTSCIWSECIIERECGWVGWGHVCSAVGNVGKGVIGGLSIKGTIPRVRHTGEDVESGVKSAVNLEVTN